MLYFPLASLLEKNATLEIKMMSWEWKRSFIVWLWWV